ncbi:hypothetical protein ET495_12680 [Xylanimonas allomyrinae]|uniref:Uncharacterized protein n=1 Tax=Xylanimonas allomyrinae TaxID=2509459 RepID=A0A4P6ER39_9MICO|nr:hypothetical protein [Xylanimonas allomyrinae]QAY63939.1 hypothetical protein ET495_12680 [Xylanimonas allomyrinae]
MLRIVPASVLRDTPMLRNHSLDRLVALSESYTCRICRRLHCCEYCDASKHAAWCAAFTDCAQCGAPVGEDCLVDCTLSELVGSVAHVVQAG